LRIFFWAGRRSRSFGAAYVRHMRWMETAVSEGRRRRLRAGGAAAAQEFSDCCRLLFFALEKETDICVRTLAEGENDDDDDDFRCTLLAFSKPSRSAVYL